MRCNTVSLSVRGRSLQGLPCLLITLESGRQYQIVVVKQLFDYLSETKRSVPEICRKSNVENNFTSKRQLSVLRGWSTRDLSSTGPGPGFEARPKALKPQI